MSIAMCVSLAHAFSCIAIHTKEIPLGIINTKNASDADRTNLVAVLQKNKAQ